MKKINGVLAAVAVGVVAYVGATWFVGKKAQSAVEQQAANANVHLADWVGSSAKGMQAKLTIDDYQRGLFSSEAVYALRISENNEETFQVLFRDEIQHGPLPLKGIATGDVAPVLALSQVQLLSTPATQAWFEATQGRTPFTAHTEVKFSGRLISDLQMQPLSLKNGKGTLEFAGVQAAMQADDKGTDNQFTMDMPLLDYAAGGVRVVIDDMRIQYLGSKAGDVARKDATVNVANIKLASTEQAELDMRGFSFQMGGDSRADQVNAYARYNLAQLVNADTDWGSVSMGLAARDFNLEAASQLVSLLTDLAQRHGHDAKWRLTSEETARLHNILADLMTAESSLTLDPANWKNEQGESAIRMAVELSRPEMSLPDATGLLLAQAVDAVDASFSIEKAMLTHAFSHPTPSQPFNAQEMAAAVAALYEKYAHRLQIVGLATEKDGVLSASVKYRDGQVNTNGREMSLPEFIQRALMVFVM